jgi:hexosaminidase
MTPGKPLYFDHTQSKNEDSITIGGYNSLEDVYNYEPIPSVLNAEQAKYILGAQANLWTEYIKNERKVEYHLFPRLFALSEVLWSQKEKRNWSDFEKRLPSLFKSLDDKKINYSKAYYALEAKVLPRKDSNKGVLWQLTSKNKNDKICTSSLIGTGDVMSNEGLAEIPVTNDAHLSATICTTNSSTNTITQKFSFNKATGKKITLATEASKNYPGDGAFTLVNGVQNEKGLAKSSEFLGFNGTDLDATIDFGKVIEVSTIKIHTLNQNGSWIYLPSEIQIECMPFIDLNAPPTRHAPIETLTFKTTPDNNLQIIKLPETKTCGQIRIVVKNYGMIPSGNPGAGNKAWLFVDEIEVE